MGGYLLKAADRAAAVGIDWRQGYLGPGETVEADVQGPSRETRQAMWELAGLERNAERLQRLQTDPYPLARLVAASALKREETRGSHGREEFPETDPRLDRHHTILDAGSETPRFEAWTDS